MIGNGYPFGASGYVILEEGDINSSTLQLDVRHYLVVQPNGEQVSGSFSFEEAQNFIRDVESKTK